MLSWSTAGWTGGSPGKRQPVELVLQDRVHALEVVGASPQAAPGGRFHALGRIGFRQPQNPQARPISHLRMALGRQDRFHQLPGVGSDLLGIFDQPRRRAPHILLVRLGHVLGQRSRFSPQCEPAPAFALDPEATASSHAASLMARLAVGVLVAIVLINIPLNAQGVALARSIPSSASLVITNGLVVKEAGSPDIYVYRDDAFHWITSLDAFDYFGYRWQNVHSVEAGFLNQYPKGTPIYVLLKCNSSPNIYQLDAGHKRWIVDIPTFTAQGYVWEYVKIVPCEYLRALPDGDSVPPGRGLAPSPLP